MLETLEIETAANPDAAVIWLHGLGADAHDFEPVVPEIIRHGERAWRFVFPNAPIRPVTVNNGMPMRAWYDITSFGGGTRVDDIPGFRVAAQQVTELVMHQIQLGIPAMRIVVGGFSQGGAVSLYAVPRLAERLAGVLALSCYLPAVSSLAVEHLSANDATPIFMAHGLQDPVLPYALGIQGRDLLLAAKYPVEWHQYPMPHSVCAAEIADIRAFLLRVLSA